MLHHDTKNVVCCFSSIFVIYRARPIVGRIYKQDEIKAIADGGGFGSIIGRNSFQRSHDDAVKLVGQIMDIYQGKKASTMEPALSL